jgi:hypothetical protein
LRQRSGLATFQFIDLDLRDPGNETKMIIVALVPLPVGGYLSRFLVSERLEPNQAGWVDCSHGAYFIHREFVIEQACDHRSDTLYGRWCSADAVVRARNAGNRSRALGSSTAGR